MSFVMWIYLNILLWLCCKQQTGGRQVATLEDQIVGTCGGLGKRGR